MIKLCNCTKNYNGKYVFSNLSYEFGNHCYILKGRNGVGKSVLCRCILGLESFSEGDCILKTRKILYLSDMAIAENWLTVDENIELLLYYYNIKISDEAKSEIKNKLELMDNNQILTKLSKGTGIKIGLFLLFIKKHWDLIILDETLSHLDAETREKVMTELYMRQKEGSTEILISHDNINMETVSKYDFKTLQLDNIGIHEVLE